jgi:hypothetical protein
MKPNLLRRLARLANVASEWLVLIFLVWVALPPVVFRPPSLTVVPSVDLLDGSWVVDLSYKAAGGIWLGRDVAFTYGPLFQWLSSAPARWMGLTLGAAYTNWFTLPQVLIVVITFLTVHLLLPNASPWRRALLLWLVLVYWLAFDIRALQARP